MTEIVLNDTKYSVSEIINLRGQGVKIVLKPDQIEGYDEATKNNTVELPIVVAIGEKYKALVVPLFTPAKPFTKFILLSKIVLKKAKVLPPQPPRAVRQDDDRPRDGYGYQGRRPAALIGSMERFNNPSTDRHDSRKPHEHQPPQTTSGSDAFNNEGRHNAFAKQNPQRRPNTTPSINNRYGSAKPPFNNGQSR